MTIEKEISLKEKRMHELGDLLQDVTHPEFDQRLSERNSISVQLEVLKQKQSGEWQPKTVTPAYKLPNI